LRGLLALHRLIMLFRELCKTSSVDITYNELIIMLSICTKKNYIGTLHNDTMIDKALIVRTLDSLIKKGFVSKTTEGVKKKYTLTPDGVDIIDLMYKDRDVLRSIIEFNGELYDEVADIAEELGELLENKLK